MVSVFALITRIKMLHAVNAVGIVLPKTREQVVNISAVGFKPDSQGGNAGSGAGDSGLHSCARCFFFRFAATVARIENE